MNQGRTLFCQLMHSSSQKTEEKRDSSKKVDGCSSTGDRLGAVFEVSPARHCGQKLWKTFGQYQPVPAIYLKNKFRGALTYYGSRFM